MRWPNQAEPSDYVGVAVCRKCHTVEAAMWHQSPHAKAFATLVAKRQDANPDCLVCHVTAFGKKGGYVPGGGEPDLRGVQCEACHGAGRRHRAPGRIELKVAEATCRGCHNRDNSPSFQYEKYLRTGQLPLIWCTGCGHGIVLKGLLRAVERLKFRKDDVVMVSGIGCSSRTPGYVDFNTLHTTHGRALAFATGMKIAKPHLNVIVISGDGDGTAIGGNHFIHAARRNLDLTLLIYNNYIYGMTGGQASPTTPVGKKASTAPYGNIDQPFDISGLAKTAGASFVARCTAYHVRLLDRLIEQALQKRGFAVVEVLVPCPTAYGRRNKEGKAVDMMRALKESAVRVDRAAEMSTDELAGKTIIGVLVDRDTPEYTDLHNELVAQSSREGE